MSWEDYIPHERARWRSMDYQKLRTRLTRITVADKLRAFIEMANSAAGPSPYNVNINRANALNLLGAAINRAGELGHRAVRDMGVSYLTSISEVAQTIHAPVPQVDPSNPRNLTSHQIQVVRNNLVRDMPRWTFVEFESFFRRRNHLLRAEIQELAAYLNRIAITDPRNLMSGPTRLNNIQALNLLDSAAIRAEQYGYGDLLRGIVFMVNEARSRVEQFQRIHLEQLQQRAEEIRLEEMRRENAERAKKGIRKIRFLKKEKPEPKSKGDKPWKRKVAPGVADVDIEDLLKDD